MNLISMEKKYRRRGGTKPVRVLCVDATDDQPVLYLAEDGRVKRTEADGSWNNATSNYHDDLVEYIEPKMVPLGPEDVPVGSAIKTRAFSKSPIWTSVIFVYDDGVCVRLDGLITSWKELKNHSLINRNDGKGWVACEKPAQE